MSIHRAVDDAEIMQIPGFEPPLPDYSAMVDFSADGHFLTVASGSRITCVEIWGLEKRQLIERFKGRFCRTFAFSPDSRRVALSFNVKRYPIEVYDLLERRIIASFDHGTLPYCIRFHPFKNQLATSSDVSNDVRVWDLDSRTVTRRLPHPRPVLGLDWSPEGKRLATACTDCQVYLWTPATSEPRILKGGHDWWATRVSFSPDGGYLASTGWDGTWRLWDCSTCQQVFKLPASGFTSGFSRTSPRLWFAASNGKLTFLELEPGRECRLLRSDPAVEPRAETCDFSPDGQLLLTAHYDGARLWNLASGELIGYLPEKTTYCAAFGPCKNHCLIASDSGIKEWTLGAELQSRATTIRGVRTFPATDSGTRSLSWGEGRGEGELGSRRFDGLRMSDPDPQNA